MSVTLSGIRSRNSILIVENHPLTRRLLREWLSREFPAIDVTDAESGEAALAAAAARELDIVLMDVRLSGIDGIETTRRLHQFQPITRIVVLTNHELPHYQRAAEDAGAFGFVHKRSLHRDLPPLLGRLLVPAGGEQ